MAIIIPSKNIYDKNNEIIRNNQIDKVEITAKQIENITDNENVYNEDVSVLEDNTEKIPVSNLNIETTTDIDYGYRYWAATYLEVTPQYLNVSITISKQLKNKVINKLLTGLNENGQSNIQSSISGNIKTGNAEGNAVYQTIGGNFINFNTTNVVSEPSVYNLTNNDVPTSLTYTYRFNPTSSGIVSLSVTSTSNIEFNNKDNTNTENATEKENDYVINLKIFVGLKVIKLQGGIHKEGISAINQTIPLTGTYQEYEALKASISFYGITLSIDLTDNTLIVGEGKKSYSITGNELIQTSNYYGENKENSIIKNSNKILNQYKNGLQLATILCSISNYYDENNNLVIAPTKKTQTVDVEVGEQLSSYGGNSRLSLYLKNGVLNIGDEIEYINEKGKINEYDEENDYYILVAPTNGQFENSTGIITAKVLNIQMVFRMHDEVIPYVYSANGVDIPMSLNQDGTPKVFRVIGTNIYYDGAVWQELTLKEKIST